MLFFKNVLFALISPLTLYIGNVYDLSPLTPPTPLSYAPDNSSTNMGSSINDVMLFLGIFLPPPPVMLFHASFNIVGHADPTPPLPLSGMTSFMNDPYFNINDKKVSFKGIATPGKSLNFKISW